MNDAAAPSKCSRFRIYRERLHLSGAAAGE